jgi:hypothetical protein
MSAAILAGCRSALANGAAGRESGVVARDPWDSSCERPLMGDPGRLGINRDILPPGSTPG